MPEAKQLPKELDPKVVSLSLNAFMKQADELAKKFKWSDEQLDKMLVHVDEQKVVTGAKKVCTSTRTAIDAEHKEKKAPYLAVTKALDAAKKKASDAIKKIEAPIDAAILRRKKADEEAAKKAQEDRLAELERRLAESEAKLAAVGAAETEFESKQIVFTLAGRTNITAFKKIVGADVFNSLLYDEEGNQYDLEVTVARKELLERK